ncbi:unnamed protein product [Orchesella dallaii]|uniref:Uncharacterized protein n=1 Tax=Orchesella dallaii TaxID=48710 RepID=A0ABP1QLX5_9HEXA
MELILVLCLVAATPAVSAGNSNYPLNPYEAELDRSRSAWNFGGHYTRQAPWLINRPRQNIPGTVIADRRTGSALPFQPTSPLMPVPLRQILHPPSQNPLPQQYQYPTPKQQQQVKPKPTQSKISKPKRKSKRPSPKRTKPSKMISPKFAGLERHASRRKASQPQPVYSANNNRTSRSQPQSPSKGRASRKITSNSRSDTVLEKFRKEDLWHLDKGESYPLRNKDIADDQHLREYGHSLADHDDDDDHENELENDHENDHENEIHNDHHNEKNQKHHEEEEVHVKHHHKHEHDGDNSNSKETHDESTRHKLEEEAEKVVAQSMKGQPHSSSEGKDVQHVHHHHHHHSEEHKNATKPEKKKEKKPEKNKLTPIPVPRIHNPIPLGCLFTWPVFHPIRPRHQLACLLSIPGTPNLNKRRRRRSTDSQQQSSMGGMSGQSQNHQFYQYQPSANQNQGMSQYAPIRKAYASHVGGGKAPMPPQSSPVNSNLKVPATIIPPPKFDKKDILQMLLGSGGVDMTEIGTVLMSNNRYVRYGRGLPNSSGRKGRNLWAAYSPQPTRQSISVASSPTVAAVPHKQQQTIKQFPSVGKPLQSQSQGRSPVVSLTPVAMAMPSSAAASRANFVVGAAPSKSYVNPYQSQPNRVQSQLKPGMGYSSKFPSAASTIPGQSLQSPYFNTIRNYKYTEWSPIKDLKLSPFSNIISLANQHFAANILSAESQQQSESVKSPSPSSSTVADTSLSPDSLTDSKNHNDIDVSDLAEAVGTYRGPTKSKSKTKVKFEKEEKNLSSFPPSTSLSNNDNKNDKKKSNGLKSFSYAVKNKNIKNNDDSKDFVELDEEENDDDASASSSDKLRFSVLNDYGEEELEVYVPKIPRKGDKCNVGSPNMVKVIILFCNLLKHSCHGTGVCMGLISSLMPSSAFNFFHAWVADETLSKSDDRASLSIFWRVLTGIFHCVLWKVGLVLTEMTTTLTYLVSLNSLCAAVRVYGWKMSVGSYKESKQKTATLYRNIQIITNTYNELTKDSLQIIFVLGFVVAETTCIYLSVKIISTNQLVVIGFSFLVVLNCGLGILIFLGLGAQIYKDAGITVRKLRSTSYYRVSKWYRKLVKSFYIVRIRFSASNFFEPLTPLVIEEFCVSSAISLLLVT